jgi:hypothetical protein
MYPQLNHEPRFKCVLGGRDHDRIVKSVPISNKVSYYTAHVEV